MSDILVKVLAEHGSAPLGIVGSFNPISAWACTCGESDTSGESTRAQHLAYVTQWFIVEKLQRRGLAEYVIAAAGSWPDDRDDIVGRAIFDWLEIFKPHRTGWLPESTVRIRCSEDSGMYGTCGCPIRCNLDAGHDGPHDAQLDGGAR